MALEIIGIEEFKSRGVVGIIGDKSKIRAYFYPIMLAIKSLGMVARTLHLYFGKKF